ncbi:hypothetical protein D3C81_1570060 [compost metagenome]
MTQFFPFVLNKLFETAGRCERPFFELRNSGHQFLPTRIIGLNNTNGKTLSTWRSPQSPDFTTHLYHIIGNSLTAKIVGQNIHRIALRNTIDINFNPLFLFDQPIAANLQIVHSHQFLRF